MLEIKELVAETKLPHFRWSEMAPSNVVEKHPIDSIGGLSQERTLAHISNNF